MSKSYSDRVMRFRRGVYASRRHLTPGCQLLLLRLSDSMDAHGIVSVPRTTLAEDLDAPTSRISEWVAEARATGFLDRVKRGRPGVTAVYQGLCMDLKGTPGRTQIGTRQVPSTGVRPPVPLEAVLRYAQHPTQVVQTEESEQPSAQEVADEAATEADAGFRVVGARWETV